ncbi:hypothetical protein BBJ28_00009567 [Nothophytophthora sp. Chile5]|nr:hypothetical protein BBJ28_00009567 [Nothophytophthora sp. Chile5]
MLQYEIRTGESVVKRNLRAQAALQAPPSSPKAKRSIALLILCYGWLVTSSPRYSFLSGSNFAASIELNPVIDRSKDAPDFSFGAAANPRPPIGASVAAIAARTSSPRSKQLHSRYQKAPSPLIRHTGASVVAPPPGFEGDSEVLEEPTTESRKTPQLFDTLSRTLCVEPDQNVSCLLPSNRIGSNFTATAANLMTEKSASQLGQSTQVGGGLVLAESPAFSTHLPNDQSNAMVHHDTTSEQRYFEYLSDDKLIDLCFLSPLPGDLEKRVVASAVKYVVGPSTGQIEGVLEASRQEFVDDYFISAKKAILNYLLMRAASCQRLGIPHGVPLHALLPTKWKWGSSTGPNGCLADLKALVVKRRKLLKHQKAGKTLHTMAGTLLGSSGRSETNSGKAVRRKRVKMKLMALLELSNPQVRALQLMWHDLYASVTLVDLPSIENLSAATEPMDILRFEQAQLDYAAKMKVLIMKNWYMKTKVMFETAVRAETFSIHTSESAVTFRVRHLFDTVATIMSLQIRSLLMKSIGAYVAFFEQFGRLNTDETTENDRFSPGRARQPLSGLMTALILQDGQIQFRDPLVDIPSRLLNVLHNLPKLFYNLGRIETQFEESLILSNVTTTPFLWNMASQEDDFVVATIRIRAIIEQNLSQLRKLQSDYDCFALTYQYVNSVDCLHLEETSGLETYRAEMERVRATAMQLAIETRNRQDLGLFSVDCHDVNATLHAELAQWTARLLYAFDHRTGRLNAELRQQYKEIAARLAKKPLDLYEMVDAEAFVHSVKTVKLQECEDRGNVIKERLRFLLFERESVQIEGPTSECAGVGELGEDGDHRLASFTGFRLSLDLLPSIAKTIKWRGHIGKLLKDAETLLMNERARIETMFIAKRSRFLAEIEEFAGEVKGFAKKGDLRHAANYVVQLAKMKDTLLVFRQAMDTIVKEEEKLQWKPSDFSKLDDIAEEMAPYEQLWKTAREFREMHSQWLRGNVLELPGKGGLQALQHMLTLVANVSQVLHLNSAAAAITAETVKKQMTDFRENVRVIVAIQNPAMKERHLKEVAGLLGLDFASEEAVTLLKLLENGVFELVNDVVSISSNATEEQQIERALTVIDNEWGTVCFEFAQSKQRFSLEALRSLSTTPDETSAVIGNATAWNVVIEKACAENLLVLVEDHSLRLQLLSSLPHSGPFAEEIASWQAFTAVLSQTVALLANNERVWRTLVPLFAAGIVETDSREAKVFTQAAGIYYSAHVTILTQPVCKELFPRSSMVKTSSTTSLSAAETLISSLERCQELLESVKGDVHTGFQVKRSSFARFYFLSDAELVSALASGSPLAGAPSAGTLWKSLSRCFPGVHSVQLNAANDITALMSSQGELFPLGSPIATGDTPTSAWLAKLESSMTTILQASIRAAANDLPRKEFRKWCLIWPEQSLLAAIQCTWTLESERANREPNQRKAWTELVHSLHEKVDAVNKEIKAAAYPHAKATLANVFLLVTQLREVSKAVLAEIDNISVEESAESTQEIRKERQQSEPADRSPRFPWIAQPRFYFVGNVLNIRMLTSSCLPYGFEYLGNASPALLTTPLTLRCFHAIAQAASSIGKGACVEGAVGTGKSTICQQFSRLCGRLYVVYQCGNGRVSFETMASFVRATAALGAWLCIDNFQFVDVATVSMTATLCAQVMAGLAARQAQCLLLGEKVRLKQGAYFLLTLTSKCEVSTSLSRFPVEDARFFFRTIAVQAPDIEKLAEFAFQNARFVHSSALAKLVYVALSAFERGFALMHDTTGDAQEVDVLRARVTNLRVIRQIVKRATELTDLEKNQPRNNRKPSAVPIDMDESDDFHHTEASSGITSKREEDNMEHRSVCTALREHLSSIVPPSSLDLIEFILRDFAAHSLARELRTTGSFMLRARGSSVALLSSTSSASQSKWMLEEDVESYVRIHEGSWKVFGAQFGQKTVQLLQTMRCNRAVVISGDVQTGKTSLYTALSRALTHISMGDLAESKQIPSGSSSKTVGKLNPTLVAPTRCVVVCPRALVADQLLGLEAETVFAKLIHEAKTVHKADKRTQSWLILDGDLDARWSEQLLYTVDELQDDLPGQQKGLQLSSGKYLVLPAYVRLVIETTTLTNASPSFVTRIGVLHVGGEPVKESGRGWEGVLTIWKERHEAEFQGFADEIFTILDTLVAETLAASLAFVAVNFQHHGAAQSEMARVQCLLALFHSSMTQSWQNLSSMTSAKARKTAIHFFYLQALVWGIGCTTSTLERQKFHTFIYALILRGPQSGQSSLKRLLVLYFPNGTLSGSTTSNIGGDKAIGGGNPIGGSSDLSSPAKQTIYDFGFSVEFGSKWIRWTEYYDHWLHMQLGAAANESSTDQSGHNRLDQLIVPTASSAAAFCLAGQLLLTKYPTILIGPRDCGKTVCGSAWMALSAALFYAPKDAMSSSDSLPDTENVHQASDETPSERVYAGFYTRASEILLQFDTVLQRIRVERQTRPEGATNASETAKEAPPASSMSGSESADSKRTTLIFFDDLQCFNPHQRMDSALELLRMLAEHHALAKERETLQSIVVKASLKLYRLLTGSNDFSVFTEETAFTATKLQYNYRAFDLFQIVKSVCCEGRSTMTFAEKPMLARLWSHESARVMGDRLVESRESLAFHRRVLDIAITTFGVPEDAFFPPQIEGSTLKTPSLTSNWLANDLHFTSLGETSGTSNYREVTEMPKVELAIERSMMTMYRADPNASGSAETLEIVLCSYIIKHVLRVTRLLRLNGRAVLLLGARGRKMVTVTRLAAFICKKTSVVYHVPVSKPTTLQDVEATATKSWTVVLRDAMLRSVRTPDASLVFIVKGTTPAVSIYQTVDQFLSGHNMPADVISHEDLDDEVLTILREDARLEKEASDSAPVDYQADALPPYQPPLLLRSKRAMLDYFFYRVRQKFQFVLVFSPPISTQSDEKETESRQWASILWQFPHLLKVCAINYFNEWSTDSLMTMAQKCLLQSALNADKDSILQLSQAAIQLYETTRRCFESPDSNTRESEQQSHPDLKSKTALNAPIAWFDRSSSFIQVDPSMLVDQLGLFVSHYAQTEHVIATNVARYAKGLAFIDRTEETLQAEQVQAERLLPEVQRQAEITRRMSGSLEREQITANKASRGLETATALVVTQRERLATVTQEYQELIQKSRTAFEEARKTLRVFQEAIVNENEGETQATDEGSANTDSSIDANTEDAEKAARRRRRELILNFAALHQVPSSLYQLSECLGVILGIEPIEGRDAMDPDEIIMNYWESLALKMKTPDFWDTLVAFEVPEHATEKMVGVLLPICMSPDFEKDMFTSVHALAGFLCEWVQKCAAFARDFVLAAPKFVQLQHEETLLKQAERQVLQSKSEISTQESSTLQAQASRNRSEMERQKAQDKLQDSTAILQMTSSVFKVLASTRAKWKKLHSFYMDFSDHWKGDLMLGTALIAYASCISRPMRLKLHQLWTQTLSVAPLLPSPTRRPLHEVFLIDETALQKLEMNGLSPNDETTLENAVITLQSYRLPLLIDPYGVATDWLIKQLDSKGRVISAGPTSSTDTLWKEVETSIKRETPLVLMDICEQRMHDLRSLLSAKRRALFDAVNRDISARGRNGDSYRCWCHPPKHAFESRNPDLLPLTAANQATPPVFEFGSDACRLYLVYTASDALPQWISPYLNQLTAIHLDLSPSFVETQSLRKLLEAQGRLRELTEMQLLQHDMAICDEQIDGLEDELLDFLSSEMPEQVYTENSKALRIVANRSALHTLEKSKSESMSKLQTHWKGLSSYVNVAKRCRDAVWAWRDFNFVLRDSKVVEALFPLPWVWQLLVRAGESSNKSDANLEEVVACFTSALQQYVAVNLQDEDRLLFRFLLATRIWQRRVTEEAVGVECTMVTAEQSLQSRCSSDIELLTRLLALLWSQNDSKTVGVSTSASKKLLALRPLAIQAPIWSNICFLSEGSSTLRQFLAQMSTSEGGQTAWKVLADLTDKDINYPSPWQSPIPLDDFTRLCIISAVHRHRFLSEMEAFSSRELQRLQTTPVTSRRPSLSELESTSPTFHTIVAAATYSAMTQAPDRHRDLYHFWRSFSSSKAPIIVSCPSEIDFEEAVIEVARRAAATMEATSTAEFLRADEAAFETLLLSAMERGHWVLLPNLHTNSERFAQLDSIYQAVEDGRIHSDFRLWISTTQTGVEGSWMSRSATRKRWDSSFFSLKRCLHHAFAVLKHEIKAFSASSEGDEARMKQLGVFHALVSSRDHFLFAQWKTTMEFGDAELYAAIRSFLMLETEVQTTGSESIGSRVWSAMAVRGVIANVYISKVSAPQDQQLIQYCLETILHTWPTSQGGGDSEGLLEAAQVAIPEVMFARVVYSIWFIPQVSSRLQALDDSTWQMYKGLQRGDTPVVWLELLKLLPIDGHEVSSWDLARFQRLLLSRLKTFSTWSEPEESPLKLPLDQFFESQYVLEAVHQHFIRSHVGSTLCGSNCLKVVALFEDTTQLTAKDGMVYFSGVRTLGHLQLQIQDSKGQCRTEISVEGVPVVLQVTSTCLSGAIGISKSPWNTAVLSAESALDPTRATDQRKEARDSSSTQKEFLCPLYRGSGRAKRGELRIPVSSALPLGQLVLSGSCLQIQTPE